VPSAPEHPDISPTTITAIRLRCTMPGARDAELLILGAHGQVGRALVERAQQDGVSYRALSRAQCDVTDRLAVAAAVGSSRWVVNCSGYTAVDQAETEPEAAHRVNAVGPGHIASACAAAGIPLVHLSTDYVFGGEGSRPAREDDRTRPLSVYGRSKLDGELAVRDALAAHIILRTSWVFSAHGANFVRTILRLACAQPVLRVVDDQIGGPTAADGVAAAILDMIAIGRRPGFGGWGTYHFCGAPAVSWCEFARAIVADSGVAVAAIATSDFPRPAQRPRNSVLDCSRIFQVFGIRQPDWRVSLRRVRAALAATSALESSAARNGECAPEGTPQENRN
jgi:dTDP-4-dehydrorhamnose reductase